MKANAPFMPWGSPARTLSCSSRARAAHSVPSRARVRRDATRALAYGAVLWLALAGGARSTCAQAQEVAPPPPAVAPIADPVAPPAAPPAAALPPGMVQLSFQGAEVDAVVQWLAQHTGKSVIKHKDVKCKLNVLSPQSVPVGDAIQLIYRALSLEGYSALESARVIVIVPESLESKVAPEYLDGATGDVDGRQIVVRVFPLQHASAGKLKEKLRAVLSEKAKLEVDERANKIVVTDFFENIRFLAEVIRELDIPAAADAALEVFPLAHTEAKVLADLVGAVFGAEAGRPNRTAPDASTAVAAPVRVLPDNASNRLIVTAPADLMPRIEELVRTLDVEKPADVAVRVLPLAHVEAPALARELAPMYGKLRGASLKETIEITANHRSNSLVVLSSESHFQALAEVVRALDTEDADHKTMRIFALRHADADDVAKQLEDLHDAARPSGGWWRPQPESRDRVRFVANRRRNEVIVIGAAANLEKLEGLVQTLDQPVSGDDLAPRIYNLRFVSAVEVKEMLDELFQRRTTERFYWWSDSVESEDRDIGRLYGKVRFAAEPYTNSLVVTTNSEENFGAVETLLDRLDASAPSAETTLHVPLMYANSSKLASSLNILFAQEGAPARRPLPQQQQQQQRPVGNQGSNAGVPGLSFELPDKETEDIFYPWLGGQAQPRGGGRENRDTRPVSDLVGRVRCVPDLRTNSLLITSSPHHFPQVLSIIGDLDVPTPQVHIEAKIIEVVRDDKERLGIRWSPDGDLVFDAEDMDNSLLGSGALSYLETLLGASDDTKRRGVITGAASLDVLVQFLQKYSNAQVRAEPRINVADNERGQLFVGSRVPFISGSINTPEGGRSDTFTYLNVGIILEVTPHINSSGEVDLSIRVESSQIRAGETLFGGAILDTRNYRTDLTVQNGKVLVLGGIIRREELSVERKVPLLGSIPLLGWFFKKRDTIERDSELMVFLRPTVTRTPEDVRKLMEHERNRLRAIGEWEDEQDEP